MSATLPANRGADEFITTSEIARLAAVQPSAVSNWRKRFADFPRPVGTAPTGGDLFSHHDVEHWLRRTGRNPKPVKAAPKQLWAAADRLRGTATAGGLASLVATAAAFVYLARRDSVAALDFRADPGRLVNQVERVAAGFEHADPRIRGLFTPLLAAKPADLRLLLDSADSLEAAGELAYAVDASLDRGLRYGELQFRTPEAVTTLMLSLAEPKGTVLDPAVGTAEFLVRAAASRHVEVYGQELNEDAWRIGVSRLLINGIAPAIALGDSLFADAYESLRTDVVLCDPPAGVRLEDRGFVPGDPRWRLLGSLEAPPSRAADFAWLAHVIHHLKDDGRGYVLLPQGALFHGGSEGRFRAELLRQGTVEAVVVLPRTPGMVPSSTLWIVRPPATAPADVLLIDADNAASSRAVPVDRVVKAVRMWRARPKQFEPIAGFARAVSVLELLSGDASLLPRRWVSEPELLDAESLVSAVDQAKAAVAAGRELLPKDPPNVGMRSLDDPPQRFRVGELIEHGLASLVRPSRLRTEELKDEGIPVWTPPDIRPGWERGEEPRFADPSMVDPKSVTEPGDIVITTVGELRTRVDAVGGHVLGTSLHALRLDATLFDPETVAALLTSRQNRALMAGTIARVNIRELEFPQLVPEDAARLRDALHAADAEQRAGRAVAEAAAALRSALVDAVSTGVATVGDVSGKRGSKPKKTVERS